MPSNIWPRNLGDEHAFEFLRGGLGGRGIRRGVRRVHGAALARSSWRSDVDGRRSSDHLDFGLQRARRLDRLQDGDDVARADAQRVQPVDQLLQATPSCSTAILLPLLSSIWIWVRGTTWVVPVLRRARAG